MEQRRGKRFVVEGDDGTGKSTVADLTADKLRFYGRRVIRVDEPDSPKDIDGNILVPISSELRKIVKNGALERDGITDLFIFSATRRASRSFTNQKLLEGFDVVQARNEDSTDAFQGFGDGVDRELIKQITKIAVGEFIPADYECILDLPDEDERQRRIDERGPLEVPDTFEMRESGFQTRKRLGYLAIAKEKNLPVFSTLNRTADEVATIVWDDILRKVFLN